ncbi:MAG: hypothetical protein ACI92O_003559 [Colwellia sp.]|jgi:hypothetical protein|tara:strand:+ start:15107 stop:15235 length:129 start_codon:yes stop_codon:yes gene_type:complete
MIASRQNKKNSKNTPSPLKNESGDKLQVTVRKILALLGSYII